MRYFLDCGAHCGESIIRAKMEFDDVFIYSFEPIPYFTEQLKEKYVNDDKVVINECAVWIEDCEKEFYISEKITDGSSLYEENGNYFRQFSKLNYINSKCIDLSNWIRNNFTKDDYIILKLDVESSEYEILLKMIKDETIFYINELYCEFHMLPENAILPENANRIKMMKEEIMNFLQKNNIQIKIWEEYNIDSSFKRPDNLLKVIKTIEKQ